VQYPNKTVGRFWRGERKEHKKLERFDGKRRKSKGGKSKLGNKGKRYLQLAQVLSGERPSRRSHFCGRLVRRTTRKEKGEGTGGALTSCQSIRTSDEERKIEKATRGRGEGEGIANIKKILEPVKWN